jgi:DNA-directed RNA polymerase subunit beta'
VRIKDVEFGPDGEHPSSSVKRYETTVGRALLSEILPAGLPFSIIDKALKKKEISKLINATFRRCGLKETVVFADKLMHRLHAGDSRRHLHCGQGHADPGEKNVLIGAAGKGSEGDRRNTPRVW